VQRLTEINAIPALRPTISIEAVQRADEKPHGSLGRKRALCSSTMANLPPKAAWDDRVGVRGSRRTVALMNDFAADDSDPGRDRMHL
jgi:hypothetical protein